MKKRFLSGALSLIIFLFVFNVMPPLETFADASQLGYLDLNKANEYAEMYAYSTNPAYTFYPNNDCANYVSQILIYAGLNVPIITGVYTMRDYYVDKGIEYISNPSVSQIEAGDILYTSSVHVMFVQKVENGNVYTTGHTNARLYFNTTLRYGVLKTSVLCNTNRSPEIYISGVDTPSAIYYGDDFIISGIVSSDLPLTSIKIGFYDGVDKKIFEYDVETNGNTSCSIEGGVEYMPVGVYTCRVTASNSEKTNEVLYEKTFAVLSYDKTLDDGTYRINVSYNSTYVMGAAGNNDTDNVQIYVDNSQNGFPIQTWNIEYKDGGFYAIRNFSSGLYLDVYFGRTNEGTNIQQCNYNGGDNQLWQILPAGGNTYCLVPKNALDSSADVSGTDGSNIAIYRSHLGSNQRFVFTHTDCNFTSGNKITFNENGGNLLSSAYASHTVNGVNKSLNSGELVIYNTPGQAITAPNSNCILAEVNEDGLVTYYDKYGTDYYCTVPSGGFIIIGHNNGSNDGAAFLEEVELFNDYIGYNHSTKTVYAYDSKNDYLANHKYVEGGSVYGELPELIRPGYDFDGWYTSSSGGTKVTSDSYYSTNTLYAHWKSPTGVVQINSATFPDAVFRAYISEEVDEDKSGWLSKEEISNTWTVRLSNKGIHDLTGIEYLTSMLWLFCANNNLTSLDLSKNRRLEILNCSGNKIVSLDLSNNQNLTHINCFKNNLVNVDVSNTQTIKDIFHCTTDSEGTPGTENNFNIGTVKSSYSLSNLTKYGFVSSKASNWKGATYNSASNTLTDFTSTKISYNYDCGNGLTATLYLTAVIDKNVVQINETTFPDKNFRDCISEKADTDKDGWLSENEISDTLTLGIYEKNIDSLAGIEYLTSLRSLICRNNNLKSLDLSKNKDLNNLNCSNNNLISLKLSNNTKFNSLNCNNNKFNIGSVTGAYSLSNLEKYGFDSSRASNWKGAMYNSASNTLSEFTSTTISYDYDCGNGYTATFYLAADSIPSDKKIDINSTNFPDSVFRNYVLDNIDTDGDEKLSVTEIESTKSIILSRCQDNGAKNLAGIEYFTELTELDCRFNALTSLNVSENTKLQRLFCGSNKLTSLDVRNNTELTYLDCMENDLTAIDVRANKKLKTLDCNDNNITSLDVTNNKELEVLYCYLNELTTLDVSRNTKLKSLKAHSNCLTNIDLSNTQITKTNLTNNRFEIGRESTYDLSNLAKYGFDPKRASNWQGAVYKGGELSCISGSDIMYDYDCGNGITAMFMLYRDPVSLKDQSTNIGISSVVGFGYNTMFSAAPNQSSISLGNGMIAVKVYDTSLIKTDSGENYDGEVSVSIPVPDGYELAKLKVLRKEANGTFTDMKAVYDPTDKTLDFEADSMGTYIVASSDTEIAKGDLNNDGFVDLKDLAVMKYALAADNPGQHADIADLNGDGEVNLKDLAMLKYLISEK